MRVYTVRRGSAGILFFIVFPLLSNCGLPDESYLPPVSISAIQVTMTSRATIQLPNNITDPNFKNFKLFYRIYISDQDVTESIAQDNTDLMGTINSTLRSNVSSINTDPANTAINTATVRNYFTSYRFYELELEGRSMDTFLRTSGRLLIDFPLITGSIPYVEKGSERYNLFRSTGDGVFTPETDDLYLRNTEKLNSSAFANTTQNADVADNASAGTPRYTYILIYIVSSGFDSSNLNTIYSTPTFVGVFRLPELS